MKMLVSVFLCFCCLHSLAQIEPSLQERNIQRVTTINELSAYTGPAQTLLVTDPNIGGNFYYSQEKNKVDSGIVFPAHDKGYWIRIYDKTSPVHLSWFQPHMDSVTDDGPALKRALSYNYVKIDAIIALSGKLKIPAGKSIEFTAAGAIIITDTIPLKFEASLSASDFQYIFRGTGNVILGSNSTPYVSACWFGAVADCKGFSSGKGTDNTRPIQAAINAAQKVSDVFIPPVASNTAYRIGSTITVSKKLHFFSFRLRGGGTTITYSADDRATVLFADFKEGVAINVQGSRRVYISDMALRGVNMAPKRIGAYDTITVTDAVNHPDNFLSDGVKRNYTAIATDAEKNNKLWSADVVFERLNIDFFALGIGISQAGNMQGDRMRIEKTQINHCVYGISLGNAQNRSCHFSDVDMTRVWCGITNTKYGNNTGCMFQLTGGQWCHVFKCFDIRPSYMGQCSINGLYTEAIGSIGTIGNDNPNNASVIFTGCYFFMRDEGLHSHSMFNPPFYTMWAYGNVTFNGCNFWAGRHFIAMYAGSATGGYNGSAIMMNGCSIHTCNALHIKGNAIIENTYFIPISEEMNYNRSITADFSTNKRYNTGYAATTLISGMENEDAITTKTTGVRTIIRTIPRFFRTLPANGGITDISLTRDSMSFSFSKSLSDSFFRYVMPGDVIGTTLADAATTGYDNPTLVVRQIDYSARRVTATARSAKITFDKIGLYTNSFFTTGYITGQVHSGSNHITDVDNISMLNNGDFITFRESEKVYRIKQVNTTDSTLELMDNMEATDGRKVLYNELTANAMEKYEPATNSIKTITTNTTLLPTDNTIVVNGSTDNVTITLPATALPGKTYVIKKTNDQHIVTIIVDGEGTIDGQKKYALKNVWESLQVQYYNSNYIILGK